MRKEVMRGVVAATAVAFAVAPLAGNPPVESKGEMSARAAKRARAPQIDNSDVVLGDARAPEFKGKLTLNRTNKDQSAYKAVSTPGFRGAAQETRFGEAMVGPIVCPKWVCGANSPVIDGAAIAARRYQARQLTDKDVGAGDKPGQYPRQKPAADEPSTAPRAQKALRRRGLNAASQRPRFGEASGHNLNSPIVDGTATSTHAFHEVNLSGSPNGAGLAVDGIRMGRVAYALDVKGATVIARPRTSPAGALTGARLAGLVLDLRDAGGEKYAVHFVGASSTTLWAGAPGSVPTYTLTYTSAADHRPRPLCTTGFNEAILFSGDRYDTASKTVTATGESTRGWVNIACAGTALAKLYLLRHTEASQQMPTTREERQAMLKMLTCDVCGDGTPFTVHGQPLLWADAKGITRFARTPASLEAVWNENGAVCLDRPRRPELSAAIKARCGELPRCTQQARGHVMSANPR